MLTFGRRLLQRILPATNHERNDLLRYLRPALRSAMVLAVVAMLSTPSLAIAADTSPNSPLASETKVRGVAERLEEAITIPFYRPPTMPPLPFSQPQIGPFIKHSPVDNVDTWTTAFIPADGKFTPEFDIPEEEAKWIRVDLSEQLLFAYERDKPVRAFLISSGLPRTPTVTGEFRIRMKVRAQTMSGGNEEFGNAYSLPNVQWVQYFYQDYGFHGTYWHNNFGNPMSHGCVNMTNTDARWLFDWAGPAWADNNAVWQRPSEDDPGTVVIVHE